LFIHQENLDFIFPFDANMRDNFCVDLAILIGRVTALYDVVIGLGDFLVLLLWGSLLGGQTKNYLRRLLAVPRTALKVRGESEGVTENSTSPPPANDLEINTTYAN